MRREETDEQEKKSASMELVAFDQIDLTKVFSEGDVDPMLEGMAKKVKDFTPDTSTSKGRKEIISRAGSVSSARAELDRLRKQSISDQMEVIAKVNASGKKIQDFTANLRDEVRKPVTDWEAEKAKKDEELRIAEEARIEAEEKLADYLCHWDQAIIDNDLIDREREVARKEAIFAKQEEERKAKEEKEKQERERLEREEQIKKDAEEQAKKESEKKVKDAEKKRIEAEFKAKEEKRKTKEAEKRAEQERIDSEKASEQAETDRIAAEKKAEDDKALAIENEKKLAKEKEEAAAKKVEEDRIEAEEKAEKEKQQAIDDEKIKARAEADRIEKERLEKERQEQDRIRAEKKEQDKKSADLEHRKEVNNFALLDFVEILGKIELPPPSDSLQNYYEAIGKGLIRAIAKKKISHITINY